MAATVIKELHFPNFDLYKRNDRIIIVRASEGANSTIAEAREYVSLLHDVTNGVPHAVLYIPAKYSLVDSATRAYLATDESLKDIKAIAGVLKTTAHRLMGNLFLEYNKPNVPVKFFEDEDEAISWLLTQL